MKLLLVILLTSITTAYSIPNLTNNRVRELRDVKDRKVDIIERLIRSLFVPKKDINRVEELDGEASFREKRWNRQMFGCQCSGFRVGCRTTKFCKYKHGEDFHCIRDCCGLQCTQKY
ncbi:hypothetical protein SNE40_005868 [Patella caerulea]|uniref:Uncharacterized protein n=1 Tax=Patella caerulea TaxID=87958 RepID=A0AAN8JXS7_PATCE